MSQAAASLQKEIDAIDVSLLLSPDDPGDRIVARQEAFELMYGYFQNQAPTIDSKAVSIDEWDQYHLPRIETGPERIDYKAIKAKNPIVDYIGRFGPVKRVGATWIAHCPGHDDKHPSLKIYPATDSFWCPVCRTGGDIFHYEALRRGEANATPLAP